MKLDRLHFRLLIENRAVGPIPEEPTGRLHRLDLTLALHADQGGKTTLIYCRFKSVWMHHLIYVKHIASELPLSSERDSRCFESSGLCQISPALWLPCVSSN